MSTTYNTIEEVLESEGFTDQEKNAISNYCEGAERVQVTLEWNLVAVRKFVVVNEVFGIEYAEYETTQVDIESEISVLTALCYSRESKFI